MKTYRVGFWTVKFKQESILCRFFRVNGHYMKTNLARKHLSNGIIMMELINWSLLQIPNHMNQLIVIHQVPPLRILSTSNGSTDSFSLMVPD